MLGLVLFLAGCSKKPAPIDVSTVGGTQQVTPGPSREEEEAARRAREAAIAERERSVMEESMRRRFAEQAAAGAMSRDEFANQDVHFAFDSFLLDDEAKTVLEKKASWLKSNPSAAVKIEGHCDERGTTAYNLALGERRANAAKQYLTALGVPASRLSTISYGEESPLDPGHNESAWARNRRAHFAVTGQ
jgi:peptidoglycan-associated lipoprotein